MLRAITHAVSPRLAECELTHFDRTPIDVERASEEHEEYCRTLERLGVAVTRLDGNSHHPDACFVEDTAVVLEETAILCSMGAASRRGETALIERELARYRPIARIELPATIEGGDVLLMGRRLFVGLSTRTNEPGIRAFAELLGPLGYQIIPVPTTGSLHLKSACTAIDDEAVFVNPEWIDTAPLAGLDLVPVPAGESGAVCLLRVGDSLCVPAGFPRTAELLARRVDRIEIVDNAELRKAEAGLTCCSLLFED